MNTYTGVTTLNAGTMHVTSLADIGDPSAIGRGDDTSPATNAASLVFNGGALQYTGSNATIFQTAQTPTITIDRLFTLAGNGTIESSGQWGNSGLNAGAANNAALVFANTASVAFSGTGTRTLTLGGTSTGDNEMGLQLVNNPNGGAALAVTKAGVGMWVLGNAGNSYTGATVINRGILQAADGSTLPTNSPIQFNNTGSNERAVLQASGTFGRPLAAAATAGSNTVTFTGNGGFAAWTSKLTVNLGGAAAGVTWDAGGFIPNTRNLVLNSVTALADVEFVNPINLGAAARTVDVDDNPNTFLDYGTISGTISGTGGGLTKIGGGTLVLTGANTYTGATSINAGTLIVQSLGGGAVASSNLGAGAGALNIGTGTTGGTLSYVGSGETSSRTINMAGTTGGAVIESNGAGALVINSLNNTGAGAKTLTLQGLNTDANEIAANLANNAANVLTVTANQAGTWILSGNNTYTGNTNANGQVTLGFGSDTAAGAGTVTSDNSTLFAARGDRALANAIDLRGGRTTYFVGDYSLSFGGLARVGTDNGDSTITNNLAAGKTLTLAGTFREDDPDAGESRLATFNGSGATAITGQIINGPQATRITLNASATGSLTIGGTTANTYTGTTTLTAGTLIIAKDLTPLGSGALALNGGALQSTASFSGASDAMPNATTLSANITVSGTGNLEFGGSFTHSGGNRVLTNSLTGSTGLTLAGPVNLSENTTNRTLTLAGAGTTTVSGQVQNGGGSTASALTINAPAGTVVLANTGAANNYGGATTLLDGTIKLGASDQLPDASTAALFQPGGGATAVLDLGGFNETVNALANSGAGTSRINNSAATGSTFTVGAANGAVGFSGNVTKTGGGAISLTKTGTAAATFSGADLSGLSGGALTVSAGTLNLTGASAVAVAPSALTVAGGGALSLANLAGQPIDLASDALSLGAGAGTAILSLDLGANTAGSDNIATSIAAATANAVQFNIVSLAGFGTSSSYTLLSAASGLSGATYSLGTVPGGFTYSLVPSDTAVLLNLTPVAAGDVFWRGDLGGGSWSAVTAGNTNWSTDLAGTIDPGTGPGAASTVVFSSTAATGPAISTTLDNNFNINALKFTAAPTGVTSVAVAPGSPAGSLTIAPAAPADGIDVADNAGNVTISAPVALGANQTWNVTGTGANGSSLTVTAALSGSGNLTKTGAGALTVQANSPTYGGAVTLSGGTLNLRSPGTGDGRVIEFGSGGGANLTVTANATIDVGQLTPATTNQGNLVAMGGLTIGAQTLTVTGATASVGATTSTTGSYGLHFSGASAISGNATFTMGTSATSGAPVTLGGVVTGTGTAPTITVTGPATPAQAAALRLTNTSSATPNTFAAGTTFAVTGGTLEARVAVGGADDGTSSLGTAAITLNGGTLKIAPQLGTAVAGTNGFQGRYYNAVPAGADLNNFNYLQAPTATNTTNVINAPNNGTGFVPGAGMAARPAGVNATNVSALFTGVINITTAGYYGFNSVSDDGTQIFIDGTLVTNNNFGHGVPGQAPWGTVYLTAGPHVFAERFSQGTGGGAAVTSYQGPDTGGALVLLGSTPGTVVTPGAALSAAFNANPITLNGTATSTIDIAIDTSIPTLTSTSAGGSTLVVTSSGAPSTLTVAGATTVAGNMTFIPNNTANVVLTGAVATGASSGLGKAGTGSLKLTATPQAFPGGLTFGTTAFPVGGTLDLTDVSATFEGPLVVSTNSTTLATNVIVGAGRTLTINDNVTVGRNTGGETSILNGTGGGTLDVVNTGGVFQVGGATGATTATAATVDLTGLGTFTANLGTTGTATTSVFRVGGTSTDATGSTLVSTVRLAPTSTVTANRISVGADTGPSGATTATDTHKLVLGGTTNTLKANTIQVAGGANGRASGEILFGGATGTLSITAADGTGPADLDVANTTFGTGGTTTGRVTLTGHVATLNLDVLTIGARTGNTGGTSGTLSFGDGTTSGALDAAAINVAQKSSGSTAAGNSVLGTLDVSGGTNTWGPVNVASNASATTGAGTVTGNLNISGGATTGTTMTLGTSTAAGVAVVANYTQTGGSVVLSGNLATSGASAGSATTAINLTGGSLTVNGNLVRTGGAGTSATTLTLDGGTLNLGGAAAIGSSANPVTTTFASGALSGLAQLNGGGPLTKTTAGTLTVGGSNAYTGATTITGGTLALSNAASTNNIAGSASVIVGDSLANNSAVLNVTGLTDGRLVLASGQTLGGHGTVTGALTVGSGSTISPGTSVGTLTAGAMTWAGGGTYAFELVNPSGSTPGVDWDLIQLGAAPLTVTAATGSPFTIDATFVGALGEEHLTTWFTIAEVGAITGPNANGVANFDGSAFELPTGWVIAAEDIGAPGDGGAGQGYAVRVQVPEPTALGVLGIAAAGLMRRRRRRVARADA